VRILCECTNECCLMMGSLIYYHLLRAYLAKIMLLATS
jgi:hypothetical protein